jgi:hypothetical protein
MTCQIFEVLVGVAHGFWQGRNAIIGLSGCERWPVALCIPSGPSQGESSQGKAVGKRDTLRTSRYLRGSPVLVSCSFRKSEGE